MISEKVPDTFSHLLSKCIKPKNQQNLSKKGGRLFPTGVTGRINTKALELLARHPEGLRWAELLAKIKASDRAFHPKTINGCVWKLVQKFPEQVYKPSKGLFRLKKYK